MFMIRSQARKYITLERQRQQETTSHRSPHKLASIQPLIHAPTGANAIKPFDQSNEIEDVVSSAEVEDLISSSHVKDKQNLDHTAHASVNTAGIPANLSREGSGICIFAGKGSLRDDRVRLHRQSVLASSSHTVQTILGAGRVDPFQSYPVKVQPYMHNLVDHCKTCHFFPRYRTIPSSYCA